MDSISDFVIFDEKILRVDNYRLNEKIIVFRH